MMANERTYIKDSTSKIVAHLDEIGDGLYWVPKKVMQEIQSPCFSTHCLIF